MNWISVSHTQIWYKMDTIKIFAMEIYVWYPKAELGGRGGAIAPPGPPKKKLFWFLILSFLFSVFKVRTVVGFFFFFNWLVLVADEVVKNEIYVYIFYTCFPNH